MDLRGRYLLLVDLLMFVLGFGLAFAGVFAWAGLDESGAGNMTAQAEDADMVWEERLEMSEPSVRDRSLTAAVETALDLTPAVVGFPLSATTDNRVVTLTGKVPSREKADAAIEAARDTPGVKAVVDKLVIEPSVKPSQGRIDQPQAQLDDGKPAD